MIDRFLIFGILDAPPNPKSENHNLDYHVTTTSRKAREISGTTI